MMHLPKLMCAVLLCLMALPVTAHHVLGRPSYSLSEDSNTPPSMQVETQIGKYFITFMAFPAFPQPQQAGRVNLYASRIDNGAPFQGTVTFKVKEDSWFAGEEETLGVQSVDDNVFRQGFVFHNAGNYIIQAEFEADGEPYLIDFPLRIGDPPPVGPLGITVGLLALILIGVNILQRRRRFRLMAEQSRSQDQDQ